MKNLLISGLLFCAVATVFAQDEQPGSTVSYQLNPSYCGSTGGNYNHEYPELNCYGIQFSLPGQPAGSSGSTWVYTSVSYQNPPGAYEPYGWGFFFGPSDLSGAEYTITNSSYSVDPTAPPFAAHNGFPTFPYTCANNCTTFTANITGKTPDDNGTYSAVLSANLYYYLACGHGCRYYVLVTGGTLTVNYN